MERQNNRIKYLRTPGRIYITIFISFLIVSVFLVPVFGNSFNNSYQYSDQNQTDLIVPLFSAVKTNNDTIEYENFSAGIPVTAAPLPEECPAYVKIALEPYGGIPPDAKLFSIENGSKICHGRVDESCVVTSRMVVYYLEPYNLPIYGAGDITIDIVSGGLPRYISKHWLTIEEIGVVHIIPSSEAIERLRHGEAMNMPPDPLNLTIQSIRAGYYAPANITNSSYLEPVWAINATDEIQGKDLTIYVSAERNPVQHELYGMPGPGRIQHFNQTGSSIPQPDIFTTSHILVGTSGPVSEAQARDVIVKFMNNPDLHLDYKGRSEAHNSCGQVYNWAYEDFTTGPCEFYVDTYTGGILFAKPDRSCGEIGIPGLLQLTDNSPDVAIQKVSDFIKEKYPQFDNRHVVYKFREMPDSSRHYLEYGYSGDEVNIILYFDPSDGHLQQYGVYNSNTVTKCAGNFGDPAGVVAIVALIIFYRRRQ